MAIFARTGAQFGKMGQNARNFGTNFAESFGALKDGVVNGGGRLGGIADRITSATVWTARQPVKLVSASFNRFPKLSALATIAGGTAIVAGFFRGRAEKRTQREALDQLAQPAPAPVTAQANTYQVSPQEYEAMQARMRQGGQGQGFAAAEAARRDAAQQAAPAV